ncbi:hypothetical protein cypCar_00034371 [Cyprinus carpio]|nr:hypothetical protein cypCar_00034371 [Cyprinus carpio]
MQYLRHFSSYRGILGRGTSTLPPSLPSPGRGASFHAGPRLNLLQRDRVTMLQVGSHLLQELAPVSEPGIQAKSQAPAWLPYPSSGCAYCSLFPLNEPLCRRPVLDTIRGCTWMRQTALKQLQVSAEARVGSPDSGKRG